jgi:hypothetical protein
MPSIGQWVDSMKDEKLQELYNKQLMFTDAMAGEYGALEVAAIMMTQALSLYRSALDEEDYNSMVDNISASRNKVHKFEPKFLQ